MNFKNAVISQKFLIVIIFSAVVILGLLSYWFINSLQSKALSGPDDMSKPNLPPPQLTAEEKAKIQASINAPAGKQIFSESQMTKILNSLTAPK